MGGWCEPGPGVQARPAHSSEPDPWCERGWARQETGALTKLRVGLSKVRLADDAVTVLVDMQLKACEVEGPQSPAGAAHTPGKAGGEGPGWWEKQGQGPRPWIYRERDVLGHGPQMGPRLMGVGHSLP